MHARLDRNAIGLLAVALVGCLAPRASTSIPLIGAGGTTGSLTGTGADAAPLAAETAKALADSHQAVVRIRIGGPRSLQVIPATTRTIAIAVRDPDGKNLIESATCGSDAFCYKSAIENVLAPYSPATASLVTIAVRIETFPIQRASLQAIAYKQPWTTIFDNPIRTATGSAANLSLTAGGVATADVTMAALGTPPVLVYANPLMAAEGQTIALLGSNLGTNPVRVEFGNAESSLIVGPLTTATFAVAVPASASDGKLLIYNDFGADGKDFTALTAISLPASLGEIKPNGGNTLSVSAAATTSSSTALATASVEWTFEIPAPELTGGATTEPVPTDRDIPTFSYKDPFTGKTLAATAAGEPYYPGSVTLSGRKAGLYTLQIKNGKLTSTRSIRVK